MEPHLLIPKENKVSMTYGWNNLLELSMDIMPCGGPVVGSPACAGPVPAPSLLVSGRPSPFGQSCSYWEAAAESSDLVSGDQRMGRFGPPSCSFDMKANLPIPFNGL
jgi:hypothetical protein